MRLWLVCLLLVAGACSSGTTGGRRPDGGDTGDGDADSDSDADGDRDRDSGSGGLDAAVLLDSGLDASVDSGPPIRTRDDMFGLVLNGTVPPGDVPAPEFTATAHTGDPRTRADLLGRRTVMWFYPAAFTGG